MTLSDRIRKILESKVLRPTSEPKKIGMYMIPDGVMENITTKEATKLILSEIRKVVPKESIPTRTEHLVADGWNACRQEILERLK